MSVDESIVILAPMFQVGCASASAGCTSRELGRRAAAERAAARGEHDARDLSHLPGPQRLPDRRVLGVDRHDLTAARGARLGDDRASRDQALLVREREPLAGLERGEGRGQPREPDHGVQDDVGIRMGGEAGEDGGIVGGGAGQIGRHVELGPLPLEQIGVPAGGQRHDPEIGSVPAQHVERLGPDRTGGAQDDDAGGHDSRLRGHSAQTERDLRFVPAFTRC